MPSEYARILNDLNRDVLRARPLDPLQFCANWFNNRLESERKSVVLAQQQQQQQAAQGAFAGSLGGMGAGAAAIGGAVSGAAAGGVAMDQTPPSPSSSDAFVPPASYNLGRRTSVSAESLAPTMSKSGAGAGGAGGADDAEETPAKTVIPKSDSQMQRIRSSISNNLLFRNLEDDQYTDVLLAMKEVKVDADHPVIVQGDQGDYFYIVESGNLDVYIRKDAPASTDGSTPPTLDRANLGDKKLSYGPGDSFGELALLYAQPRAASIISTSPCTLWALDRVTFRSILMETNFRRRSMYESFLKDVSLFEGLSPAEIAKISDALEPRVYEPGEYVFKQGERGTEFFIIWEGSAEVRKKRADGTEDTVGTLSRGDYFGELALLNNAPRAASIVSSPVASGSSAEGAAAPRLRVATLSEQAFTRLLGPLAGIMSRHAETHYGAGGASDLLGGGGGGAGVAPGAGGAGVGVGGSSGFPFAPGFAMGSSVHSAPQQQPPLAPHEAHRNAGAAPFDTAGAPDQAGGTWLGSSPFGMGASPFGPGAGQRGHAAAAGGPLSGYTFGQAV
ncbi:hypothetical protein OC835_007283 [Tilletia horrida]|nr:hypothetical protein OC835_007283 [Tilletia horrida]